MRVGWPSGRRARSARYESNFTTYNASELPNQVGADSIAFEQLPAGAGHRLLPAHRILLVEHGIHIMETLALEELAAAGVTEFVFVLSPLKLVGATGSPVRPLALVGSPAAGGGSDG